MNKDERDIRDSLNPSLFDTTFFVGAPPRSGNTYLRYVIKDAYNNLVEDTGLFIKHDHSSTYALEQALGVEYVAPIFVSPIRDPHATLKSKLVRTFYEWETPPNIIQYVTSVDDLCLYWEILLVNPSKFCLIDFNELVADKDSIIEKMDQKYPELVKHKNPEPLTRLGLLEYMGLEDEGKYGDNEKLFLSSGHTPRPKSEYSDMAEELLSTPAYARRLDYLYDMYNELLKLTI